MKSFRNISSFRYRLTLSNHVLKNDYHFIMRNKYFRNPNILLLCYFQPFKLNNVKFIISSRPNYAASLYDLLHVPKTATAKEIKMAYYKVTALCYC